VKPARLRHQPVRTSATTTPSPQDSHSAQVSCVRLPAPHQQHRLLLVHAQLNLPTLRENETELTALLHKPSEANVHQKRTRRPSGHKIPHVVRFARSGVVELRRQYGRKEFVHHCSDQHTWSIESCSESRSGRHDLMLGEKWETRAAKKSDARGGGATTKALAPQRGFGVVFRR